MTASADYTDAGGVPHTPPDANGLEASFRPQTRRTAMPGTLGPASSHRSTHA